MQKILLCFLLTCLLFFGFSQNQGDPSWTTLLKNYKSIDLIYQQAQLASSHSEQNEELEAKADSGFLKSLEGFNRILPEVTRKGRDSLLFFIKLKTGYIHYYFDSLEQARQDYLSALALKKNIKGIPDSFLFIPCLFTGAIYYGQGEFDSALFYYQKAEEVAAGYKNALGESQRLYNLTGVMHYETGNYRQAKNYFEKAILLTDPSDKTLITNYRINIASLLIKLESFEEAKIIYLGLLPSPVFENEIYHNLAIISIKEQQYRQAIEYLRKVSYNNKKSIDLFYNFSIAFSALNENDSADFYVQRAIAENLRWNAKRRNVQNGLILKYQGDELAKQQLYKESSGHYQLAIQQFIHGYDENDGFKNPLEFRSAFSYINLFNTLAAKGALFENWYQQDKDTRLLEAALGSYRSAFNLASYVEKTYDSDEARLFIGKIKHSVHSKPINISLSLYDLTQKKRFLEEAYLFDQQNKASTLAFNIQQHEFRTGVGRQNPLVALEYATRSAITRLSLRAAKMSDSAELMTTLNLIRDQEIELGKIRKKLDEDPTWKKRIEIEQIPTITQLQKKLDLGTALLSYHLSENGLLVLLITQSRFEYHSSVINQSFLTTLETFKTALHNTSGENRYTGSIVANRLYEKLISPLYSKLMEIKRLIIIPDDELHYLPFEALQDQNDKYLLERFAVQYQYSTALLDRAPEKKKVLTNIAFAPFAAKGFEDSIQGRFPDLPSSDDEINGLIGNIFMNETATRENFLENVRRYNIIHLATHAKVDNVNPAGSFIAFYPGKENFKLYASEIANMQLDSARLVILSACETGSGPLVKGEGLMSLSRSFAYAGCPNIVTSLWKAEDVTTAFLTKQLHVYLNKNFTKDKALQQAKLDLLASDKIDPRYKSPQFWAHLVFIGDYERRENQGNWWWIAFAFIAGAVIYKLLGKSKPE